jgi:hypothetical protein
MAGKAISKSIGSAASKARGTAGALAGAKGPSPDPMTNLVLADVALRGGGALVRHLIERGLLGTKYSPQAAKNLVKGRSMAQTLVGTALARVATRSVPGALLVGGGLIAKTLYDRSKGTRKARAEGAAKVAQQIEDGRKA